VVYNSPNVKWHMDTWSTTIVADQLNGDLTLFDMILPTQSER